MTTAQATEAELAAATQAGDADAFALLAERFRAQLQLHCYRMLGSREDAEDLVQETLLRAWSKRATYAGRSTFRAWLYGIATNACIDILRQRSKRVLPPDIAAAADPAVPPQPAADLPWLEPYPDTLLDQAAAELEPESAAITRETTELAFLAAIQHLPPRQRAVLILRDVMDWPAKQVASALETTVASVNSALQRAHATMAGHLPASDHASRSARSVTEHERALLDGMIAAWERADASALAAPAARGRAPGHAADSIVVRRARRYRCLLRRLRLRAELSGPLPCPAHGGEPPARARGLHERARWRRA